MTDQDIQESREEFADKIREVIQDHLDDFESGNPYYDMREIFDRNVTREAMKRIPNAINASRRLGVAYNTFRKMLDID